MRPQRLVQDYAANSGQPIAPAASTFGAPAAPAFGAAAPAAGGLFGAAPVAGGGMFGAPATPAFGVAPSQVVAPTPGGMFGAAPAAVAPATGGSGFGSTGGEMFGQQAPVPTFGAEPIFGCAAPIFGSTGASFSGFGAPQVSAPSSPPRSQPLRTDRRLVARRPVLTVLPLRTYWLLAGSAHHRPRYLSRLHTPQECSVCAVDRPVSSLLSLTC
jgi:hypothetical protein